jgi:hypothetical protein
MLRRLSKTGSKGGSSPTSTKEHPTHAKKHKASQKPILADKPMDTEAQRLNELEKPLQDLLKSSESISTLVQAIGTELNTLSSILSQLALGLSKREDGSQVGARVSQFVSEMDALQSSINRSLGGLFTTAVLAPLHRKIWHIKLLRQAIVDRQVLKAEADHYVCKVQALTEKAGRGGGKDAKAKTKPAENETSKLGRNQAKMKAAWGADLESRKKIMQVGPETKCLSTHLTCAWRSTLAKFGHEYCGVKMLSQ